MLGRVNDLMCPDMPAKMFVTCLYGVLEPASGRFTFANAGHNLPYVRTGDGSAELRATGMPLGLLPGIEYEETEAQLEAGQTMLLHSDGVAEAHGPEKEMFGFPRLQDVVGARSGRGEVIDRVLTELSRFTGADWEQEDDITLVALTRYGAAPVALAERVDVSFQVASEPGNEKEVSERVAQAVAPLGLPGRGSRSSNGDIRGRDERDRARQRGPRRASRRRLGAGRQPASSWSRSPTTAAAARSRRPRSPTSRRSSKGCRSRAARPLPDQNMVDDVRVSSDESRRTIELVIRLEGGDE